MRRVKKTNTAIMRCVYTLVVLLSSVLTPTATKAQSYQQTPQGQAFIRSMIGEYGYSQMELDAIFSRVARDDVILEKISRPKEKTTPWFKYRRIFLDQARIDNGVQFYRKHQYVLNEAYQQYGVSPFIITAIIGVETRYGKVMGNDKVITALSTIGFEYPKRSEFFLKELRAFLQMVKEENLDIMSLTGSYAGAMGMAQFMPSSFLNFAVDYEGDGKRNLWTNPHDAIFSVANYLKAHGWQRDGKISSSAVNQGYSGKVSHFPFATLATLKQQGLVVSDNSSDSDWGGVLMLDGETGKITFITYENFAVITTYNTSPMYAMAVKELAEAIEARLAMR